MRLAILLLVVGTAAPAQTLVVLNKSDANASLIDPSTGATLAKVPVGRGPHEVALAPDGRTAYVANFGRYTAAPPGDTLHTKGGNTLTFLDLARRTPKATHDFGTHTGLHGIAASRDGSRIWFTTETPNAVIELDLTTGATVHVWPTGQQRTHLVLPSTDESRLYATNTVSGSLTIIVRSTGETKSIPIGPGAEGMTLSPDGKELWVARRDDGRISIVSTTRDSVIETISAEGDGPQRVRFTPDGSQVWASNVRSNTITVFDARSRKLIGAVKVGSGPGGSVFSADGKIAYVALSGANQVAAIDVATLRVVKNIATGREPDGIAWAAARR